MRQVEIYDASFGPDDDGIGIAYAINFKDTHYFKPLEFDSPPPVNDFELKDGDFGDYISGDTFSLHSQRFMNLLETNKGIKDQLQWFPVKLHKNSESRDYFILHVIKSPGIVDTERSMYLGPSIYKYAFKNIEGKNIFCPDDLVGEDVFVRDEVRREIEKAKITGVSFTKTNGAIIEE